MAPFIPEVTIPVFKHKIKQFHPASKRVRAESQKLSSPSLLDTDETLPKFSWLIQDVFDVFDTDPKQLQIIEAYKADDHDTLPDTNIPFRKITVTFRETRSIRSQVVPLIANYKGYKFARRQTKRILDAQYTAYQCYMAAHDLEAGVRYIHASPDSCTISFSTNPKYSWSFPKVLNLLANYKDTVLVSRLSKFYYIKDMELYDYGCAFFANKAKRLLKQLLVNEGLLDYTVHTINNMVAIRS
jgi:hypothetical protein